MISKIERIIAFRYLKPKKKEGFLKVISIFSFTGIALGVAILIIVMSVMNGFRAELINKILGFNAHIIVKPYEKKIETGTIMSRAFKPMPIVLDLVNENFSNFTNIIFFMGKSGREIFKNTLKEWYLEYTEKKSLTSTESFLINVKKIKRKNNKGIKNH